MGTDREKAIHILTKYPEARNSYKAAMVRWWEEFDELGDVLFFSRNSDRPERPFRSWFLNKATSPHTIRNRIQEVQNDFDHLDAHEEVEEWRQKRSNQGVLK